jgi:NADH-quinone oxidoreductase subunit F
MEERVLTRNIGRPGSETLKAYRDSGGYTALSRALKEMSPEDVAERVTRSGLRGRGGAGFPTGKKWSFIPKGTGKQIYLCVNADESEPGTFKDRLLIEKDPHMVVEGTALAAYAIGCRRAYIYIRGEFVHGARVLEGALREARAAGFLGRDVLGSGVDIEIHVHRGAGAYICGEETALIESLEGKRGHPRLKPPFPAVVGLYGCPTVVNNVETLACVPHIIERGPEWFASLGPPNNGGTKLFSVSGHVSRPGVYEVRMGTPLRALLDEQCGGVAGGRRLKAVIPGGSSVPVLTADDIDVALDFESVAAKGSMLGSGGVIVMDERTCMVKAGAVVARFYAHESCGQCTPCREGTPWMERVLWRIERGEGQSGDLELLLSMCVNIFGRCLCPLGDAAAMPVRSYIQRFRDEFEYHIRERRCLAAGGFS